jgi:alkylation response protein AidB-like acyl-CoA dehydrogenase
MSWRRARVGRLSEDMMDFRVSEQEEAFRAEVRAFFDREFPPEFLQALEAEPLGERKLYDECIRRLAAKGWLGIGWPREYGGMERSMTEQLVYYIEMYLRLPHKVINPVGVATALAAPVLMRFGSDELKSEFLPRILRGGATICLGYSEPTAGTDLVGLQTTAVADGEDYVINGQKSFTTAAEYADYCWLSAKTDPNAQKRSQGISLLIVDMRSPGIKVRGVPTMARYNVNDVSFQDVRVPRRNLVGEENQGWQYVTQALSNERIGFGVEAAILRHTFEETLEYAVGARRGGRLLSQGSTMRQKLAQLAIELEVARLFGARLIWLLEQGIVPYYEASMAKVFITELEQRLANAAMQALGLDAQLQKSSKGVLLGGRVEDSYRYSVMGTIGGGSNEVQRIIMAVAGLGLPRG